MVGILLTSANGCGGDVKSKEGKHSNVKHQQLLEMFKKFRDVPSELIELLEKVDNPSVSAKSFEEMIKKYQEKSPHQGEDRPHQGEHHPQGEESSEEENE